MQAQLAEAHGIHVMAAEVRDDLLSQLSDEDLAFRLPGNPSLGELLAEHASVQRAYIDSFTSHRLDWSAIGTDTALAASVDALKERFARLDGDLRSTLESLGDDAGVVDVEIDRGGWQASTGAQLHTLREALIIALGKAVVYLRALGREVPLRVGQWVG